MFRTGEKVDFERMLDDILRRAKESAAGIASQVDAECSAHGTLHSSGVSILMEQRITPVHETALADCMKLLVQFSERTGIPIPDLCEIARPKITVFTSSITERMLAAANRMKLAQISAQSQERFNRRVENALKDVEIGFIQGRSAIVTESSTSQSKALGLLKALYDATRGQTNPVFVTELDTGLSDEENKAAWHYLKDHGLIHTFSLPYAARINGAGVDAIEGAQQHPDVPSSAFPSVSYNIVQNTMNVGTMSNSPVQQGGMHSTQNQVVTYSAQDVSDLNRIVREFEAHLHELQLDARQRQKAEAQIATIKAQLIDEPDPGIVRQAGRALLNITEGMIGSMLATAATQPGVWAWVSQAMHRLFG